MASESAITLGGGTPSITLCRGSGLQVWDDRGQSYLDCTSQGWALYLGHANREVRDHAQEVMADLWHTHQGFPTLQRERFARRLLSLIGRTSTGYAYDRVAPTVSGALAVETALKLSILNLPGRRKFARVRGGFHGTTLGVSAASWPGTDDVPDGQRSLSVYAGFGPSFASLDFPSTDATAGLRRLDAELNALGPGLCAVVVEPIQGSGGQRELPRWWLERLRDRAAEDGFLVIYDEIQTYIRAGRYFTDLENLQPHMVALGKGLGGGFPVGAVVVRSDVDGFPAQGIHDLHTFASSALSHSIAVKVIDIVERDDLLRAARDQGARLAAGLAALRSDWPLLGEIRQVGLHVGVDAVDPVTGNSSPDHARSLRAAAMSEGLLLGLGGYRPEVIKIKPPVTITTVETDEVLSRLERTLRGLNGR